MQIELLSKQLFSFLKENGILVLDDKKAATHNKTGAMVGNLSDISKQFISETKNLLDKNIVIDIGCCYGLVSLAVLTSSKCKVIAIDGEEAHIRLMQKFINKYYQNIANRLTEIVDYFPEHFDMESDSISAIHASHLLQFLPGDKLLKGLKKCYKALHSNGKIYLTTTSIYAQWLEGFPEIYNENLNKSKWPGEIHNFKDYAPENAKNFVSDFFHAMTKNELCILLEEIGFRIEKSYYYDLKNPDIHNNEKDEMIGIIAVKP